MNTTTATPGNPSVPAAWHRDPMGRHDLRYWDGRQWTQHVSSRGVAGIDPVAVAPTATRTASSSSAIRAVPAVTAGPRQMGTLAWLAICAGVGGVGLLLMNQGERTETTVFGTSTTEYSSSAMFGMSLFCIAVAMFFGRGTFRSLGRVVRGKGNLGDAIFAGASVRAALITFAAIAGAVITAGMALGA